MKKQKNIFDVGDYLKDRLINIGEIIAFYSDIVHGEKNMLVMLDAIINDQQSNPYYRFSVLASQEPIGITVPATEYIHGNTLKNLGYVVVERKDVVLYTHFTYKTTRFFDILNEASNE